MRGRVYLLLVLLLLVLLVLVVADDLELHRDDGVLEDGEEEDGVVQEVEADEGVEGHLRRRVVGTRGDSLISWSTSGVSLVHSRVVRQSTYHVLRVHHKRVVCLLLALLQVHQRPDVLQVARARPLLVCGR